MHTLRGADQRVALDATLAVVLAALGVAEVVVPFTTVTGSGSMGLALGLVLISCLPLVLRARYPLPVLLLCTVPWAVTTFVTDVPVLLWGGLVPMALATYSVARHGRGRHAPIGSAVAVTALGLMAIGNEALQSFGQLFFPALVLLAAWVTGHSIERKHRVAVSSIARADGVEARSREDTLLAIAEERSRIARELHDVVAHAVTAMVVQAGAAAQVVEENPDYARGALNQIRDTGAHALDEMRRVVSALRETDEQPSLAPQPGVADLPALVAASGTTTTRVRLVVAGSPPPVSAGLGLAAYRIVQESLTNAHRHAGATEVVVSLAYEPEGMVIEVRDDGVGQAVGTSVGRSGHGLIGMRERVAVHGGRIDFSSGDGFLVRAWLPSGGQP
ncbi:MAG: sensor histidine kinase [Humibacillus sp.]|nr:sensor histidine kinase [Humibacillus sp.]MDN5775498.1 sensor histidine kinase [Humibacillus sp.]